jgi:hypothetical protein
VVFTFALPTILMILLGSMLGGESAGQVLAAGMIGAGIVSTCANADIGRALHITEATVKTHLAAVTTAMSRHFLE